MKLWLFLWIGLCFGQPLFGSEDRASVRFEETPIPAKFYEKARQKLMERSQPRTELHIAVTRHLHLGYPDHIVGVYTFESLVKTRQYFLDGEQSRLLHRLDALEKAYREKLESFEKVSDELKVDHFKKRLQQVGEARFHVNALVLVLETLFVETKEAREALERKKELLKEARSELRQKLQAAYQEEFQKLKGARQSFWAGRLIQVEWIESKIWNRWWNSEKDPRERKKEIDLYLAAGEDLLRAHFLLIREKLEPIYEDFLRKKRDGSRQVDDFQDPRFYQKALPLFSQDYGIFQFPGQDWYLITELLRRLEAETKKLKTRLASDLGG